MTDFTLSTPSDLDDLPRTLRREHEARAREARDRDAREKGRASGLGSDFGSTGVTREGRGPAPVEATYTEPVPAAVTRFDVPFWRLALFFIKAVFAAIPALILLGVMLWYGSKALEANYPELIRMKILITFPNGAGPNGTGTP